MDSGSDGETEQWNDPQLGGETVTVAGTVLLTVSTGAFLIFLAWDYFGSPSRISAALLGWVLMLAVVLKIAEGRQ